MLGIEYPILLAGMGSRGKATPVAKARKPAKQIFEELVDGTLRALKDMQRRVQIS